MGTDDLARFGHGVRALRETKGWTQEKLAELSELDQTYVSGIERGRRNLGYRNLVKLAKALGVRASELVATGERLSPRLGRAPAKTRRSKPWP